MAEGNPIKYSDLVIDDGAIEKLLNAIDTLEKRFLQSQKNFRKEIEKTKKTTEDFTGATEDQESELEKLEKQLEKLIKANKELQETDGQLAEQKKQAVKIAKDEAKLRKKLIELDSEQTKVNAELKIDISERNRLLKEQIKREKGLTNAYDDESKSLNNLRKKYKALAVEGKDNTKEAKALLSQVTALDQKLKAVDKSVGQTQRSVGNYKEQVKEAIEETGVFTESMAGAIDTSGALGGVLGKLQTIISILTTAQSKLKNAVEDETEATDKQAVATKKATIIQKLFRKSTIGSAKAMKILKVALISSGIGIIVVLLGTLLASLSKTQAGLNGLDGIMRSFGAVLEVVVGRLITLGSALGDIFSVVIDTFVKLKLKFDNFILSIKIGFTELKDLMGDFETELKLLNKQFDDNELKIKGLTKAIDSDLDDATKSFVKTFAGLGFAIEEAIEKAMALAKASNKVKLENAKLSLEMAEQLAISEKQEEIEGDATRTFEERRKAILSSIKAQKKASELGQEIAENNLKIVNLELNQIEQNRALLTDEKIQRIEAEKEVLEAKKDASIKETQLNKVRRELLQDEVEQDLDIFIDGFDKRKSLNEEIISDETKAFKIRVQLLKETKRLSDESLDAQVKGLEKLLQGGQKTIDINSLIKQTNAVLLNQEIKKIKLSEIGRQRLFEAIRERQQSELDLAKSGVEIEKQRLSLKQEINDQLKLLTADNIENERQKAFELQKIEEDSALREIEIKEKLFERNSEEFRKLQLIKSEILQKGVEDRATIELEALTKDNERATKQLELDLINDKKNQEEINEELTKLKIEQLKKEIELEDKAGRDSIDKQLELARLTNDLILDEEQKKADGIKKIQDVTADAIFTSFQKTLDKQINELDRLEEKQKSIIDRQTARATEGLENNLAFEEDALADLEQKKIKAQKKQIALEKISALYNAYSSASASGDSNAIITVLRDFSILQGLESAISSFGSGTGEHGSIEDSLNANQNGSKGGNSIQNGVVRGESHKKRGFGVPVLVEGNEGIWKGSTMDKFGKGNFVALTKAIDSGAIGSNFMQPQVNAMQVVQTGGSDPRLLNEMVATRKAIENKPEQVVDVEKFSRNVIDFIDERKTGNKTIINRHRVTRKRF
tara:strand:+ start:4393 stop:7791 length:3399 start_codon:yes stop_codon:yes gene_type:complete